MLSLLVNIGMWLERFVIIVTSLHRDFLPSSWGMYAPTLWDFAMFIGTIGLFLALLFLFIRFLPMISIFEMRTIVPEAKLKRNTTGDVMAHAEHDTPTLYGLMAEFDNADGAGRGGDQRPRWPATARWTPTRRSRSRSSTRRSACTDAAALLVLLGGILGGARRLRPRSTGRRSSPTR